MSIYARPNWSKGYDVVFHNERFGKVNDATFVAGILASPGHGAHYDYTAIGHYTEAVKMPESSTLSPVARSGWPAHSRMTAHLRPM